MKILTTTSIAAMLIAGVIDSAFADSGELGSQFMSRSEMVRAIQSIRVNATVARLDKDDSKAGQGNASDEPVSEQEERHRELDDEFRNLIVERLEQNAEHQEELRELEEERARGVNVDADYRELMEERREQDAEHREALRELNEQRDEYNQELAAETTESAIEGKMAGSSQPWWKPAD